MIERKKKGRDQRRLDVFLEKKMSASSTQSMSTSAPLEDTHTPLTPVRRLSLSGSTSPFDESHAPSRSASPGVICSQYRLQLYEEEIRNSRYPTPPAAPPKDDYVSASQSEGGSQSPQRLPPARVFRNGKLKVHKWYSGPIPLTYVDTGVYEGGSNDYYEVYTSDDLRRARHMNFVLNHHRVPRWDV
jgi:hypothetical protein